jgi:hypothetical protein
MLSNVVVFCREKRRDRNRYLDIFVGEKCGAFIPSFSTTTSSTTSTMSVPSERAFATLFPRFPSVPPKFTGVQVDLRHLGKFVSLVRRYYATHRKEVPCASAGCAAPATQQRCGVCCVGVCQGCVDKDARLKDHKSIDVNSVHFVCDGCTYEDCFREFGPTDRSEFACESCGALCRGNSDTVTCNDTGCCTVCAACASLGVVGGESSVCSLCQ